MAPADDVLTKRFDVLRFSPDGSGLTDAGGLSADRTVVIMKLLSQALEQHRVVAFVGAGASMAAPTSLPAWREVNQAVVSALVTGASPLLRTAGEYGERVLARQQSWLLPSEYFAEVIVGTIGAAYFPVLKCLDSDIPNQTHIALARLAGGGKLQAVLTTNFDRAIEAAFATEGVALDVRFRATDLRALADDLTLLDARARPCMLVKVHGCASEPDTLVDTLSQRKRGLPSSVLAIVHHLLYGSHWMFLGFSGADLEAEPNYLGLRAAAERGVGFTWLVRNANKASKAVHALKEAWGARAEIVEGELPAWLEQQLGRHTDQSVSRREAAAQIERGAQSARVAAVASAWANDLGAPSCALVLAFLLEASGEEALALDVLQLLESKWPRNAEADELRGRYVLLLAHLAALLAARGRVHEAARWLDLAAEQTVQSADAALGSQVAKQRGNVLRQMGRIAEAETVFRDALKLAPAQVRPSILGDLAPVLAKLGRDDEARTALQSAIAGFAALGDEVHRAGELANLAALSPAGEAERLRGEALAVFDRLGHEKGRATLLLNSAKAAREAGDLERSRDLYAQAHSVANRIGDKRLGAAALHGAAVAHDEAGDSEAARSGYVAALAEAESAGDAMESASILNNLGRLHRDQGNENEATAVRDRALALYRTGGNVRGEADTLYAAALDALGRSDPAGAVAPAREARGIYGRLGDEQRCIEASTNLAAALRDSGQIDEALEVYCALLEQHHDARWASLVASWQIGAGRCALRLSKTEAAQDHLLQGVDLTAARSGLPAAAELTLLLVRETNDDEAGRSIAAALVDRLARRIGAASHQARELATSGQTNEATALLVSAAAAAQHVGMTALVGVSWTNAGRVQEMAGRSDAALKAFALGARAANSAGDFATARMAVESAIELLEGGEENDRRAMALEELAQIEDADGCELAAAEARSRAASAWLAPLASKDGVSSPDAAVDRARRAGVLLEAALPVLEDNQSARLERARYDWSFVEQVLSG